MQLPLEADSQRVVDDLLQIKLVMRKAKGSLFADMEVSGHPEEVRIGHEGVPIFRFGDVFYCHHGDGSVSELRRAEQSLLAYRHYAEDGGTLLLELQSSGAASADLARVLERATQHGEPSLN
jgi:hypothetical protein